MKLMLCFRSRGRCHGEWLTESDEDWRAVDHCRSYRATALLRLLRDRWRNYPSPNLQFPNTKIDISHARQLAQDKSQLGDCVLGPLWRQHSHLDPLGLQSHRVRYR